MNGCDIHLYEHEYNIVHIVCNLCALILAIIVTEIIIRIRP